MPYQYYITVDIIYTIKFKGKLLIHYLRQHQKSTDRRNFLHVVGTLKMVFDINSNS